jgi:hypothetical protein
MPPRKTEGMGPVPLKTRYATRPQAEIEAAFSDLTAELLLILDRLLGREMAQQICAAA